MSSTLRSWFVYWGGREAVRGEGKGLGRLLAMGVVLMFVMGAGPATRPVVEARRNRSEGWRAQSTATVGWLETKGFRAREAREGPEVGKFGGLLAKKVEATGFFRTEQIGGRWWMVDPEGHLFIHVAVNAVRPPGSRTRALPEKARKAFEEKFGTNEKWAEDTTALLWRNGFNGTGAWSLDETLNAAPRRLAYAVNWSFAAGYREKRKKDMGPAGGWPNQATFVFDPEFETFAMEHAKRLEAFKSDPWLLGHFSDNELPFLSNSLDRYLGLAKEEAGYKAAEALLRKRHGEGAGPKDVTDADRTAFRELVAERYFSVVSKAIKTHDPNHLYLGCRLHAGEKNDPALLRMAGKYADIVSINVYGRWTPSFKEMSNWVALSGKPFLATEFYVKGEDTDLGNTTGAGWLVKTQRDRGLFYQNFCLAMLQSKGCVGWHLFRYIDNDPEITDVDPSNRDSNKGIVSRYFEEYGDYLEGIRQLNRNVYDLVQWMDEKGGRAFEE